MFCDISKAFDRVWHRGLFHKLSSLGISGHLLNWFKSYLSDRKQRVVVSNPLLHSLKYLRVCPKAQYSVLYSFSFI